MNNRNFKSSRLFVGFFALFASAGALVPGVAPAADICPDGAIQLVVPWPAGGGTDLQARTIAGPLGERLNKQIVVVNRPGAGGVVGTNSFVHSATPDGCMLLLATGATNAAAPYLFKDLRFQPLADFTPVAFVAAAPNVLYVNSKSSYRTAQELIADARAHPGKFTYASGGIGASSHLAGTLFVERAGLDMVHVPFQGAAPALSALLAGQVDIAVDTAAQIGHVRSGGLRALAVASSSRLQALPDVPTFDELGFPGLHYAFWGGIAGPKDLPADLVTQLNNEANEVLRLPAVRDYFLNNGGQIRHTTPAEFAEFWAAELRRNKEIVAAAGVSAD